MRTYLDYLKAYGEDQEHNDRAENAKENESSIVSITPYLENDDDRINQGIEKQNSDNSVKEQKVCF